VLNGKREVAWFGLLHAILLTTFVASLAQGRIGMFSGLQQLTGGWFSKPSTSDLAFPTPETSGRRQTNKYAGFQVLALWKLWQIGVEHGTQMSMVG